MLFTNWMRSYPYRREMNRHWSVSTSRHRSEDDKTICEERALIDDLLFWVSIDHFYSWWNQRSSSEIFLIFDSDFYLYQFTLAALQLESELNSSDLFFWISFQSNSCRFAVRAILDSCKSSNSCNLAFYLAYQAVKSLQWRQILNHS
jgi:hypothetical protein